MDSHQAKEILASFRAGTEDVQDPIFAEALALVECDPTLAQWFERQKNADAALQAKFRATTVPADLPERILSGRRTSKPETQQWHFAWVGLAWATAILVGVFGFWLWRHEPDSFAAYRNKMAALVSDEYKMMLETNDQAAIRKYLAQNRAHPDYVSTPAMDRLSSEGCALIDWHRKRVALICFDLGGDSDLFLFVADSAAVPDAPTQITPQFASVGPMATAAWTRGDKTYLLAIKGNVEQLRKYL